MEWRERSPIEFVKRSVTNSVLLSTFRPWCSVTVMTIQVPESASLTTLLLERTRPYGDFLVNAQGEDVVAGIRNTLTLDHMKKIFPSIHSELLKIFVRLEEHYTDMCDTEFTIEQGRLWMLQTRVGKRTGAAALKMAVDMTKGTAGTRGRKWKISREEAVMRVTAEHLDSVLHRSSKKGRFDRKGSWCISWCGCWPGIFHC